MLHTQHGLQIEGLPHQQVVNFGRIWFHYTYQAFLPKLGEGALYANLQRGIDPSDVSNIAGCFNLQQGVSSLRIGFYDNLQWHFARIEFRGNHTGVCSSEKSIAYIGNRGGMQRLTRRKTDAAVRAEWLEYVEEGNGNTDGNAIVK